MPQLLPPLLTADDAANVLEHDTVSINVLGNDVGDGLLIVGYSAASGATIAQDADHNLVYTADAEAFFVLTPGQTTTDLITYTVQDVNGQTAVGHAVVTVGGAPNSPDIHGTSRTDVLMGTDGDERIWARSGGDIVMAGGGSDTIYGGAGKDQLFGGDGPDLLIAGPGRDWLLGGSGDDTLVGGHSGDVFAFDDFWGRDVVLDFDPKQDQIQLPQVYFASFKDVMNAARDDGHGDLVISTSSHEGHIDTITLVGVDAASLRASNFVFI